MDRSDQNTFATVSARTGLVAREGGLTLLRYQDAAGSKLASRGLKRVKMRRTQPEQIRSAMPCLTDLNEACRHFADGPLTDSRIAVTLGKTLAPDSRRTDEASRQSARLLRRKTVEVELFRRICAGLSNLRKLSLWVLYHDDAVPLTGHSCVLSAQLHERRLRSCRKYLGNDC